MYVTEQDIDYMPSDFENLPGTIKQAKTAYLLGILIARSPKLCKSAYGVSVIINRLFLMQIRPSQLNH